MACREMDTRSATAVIAGFLARDPARTLPKVAAFRPVAFVIAEDGETAQPWPTNDQGMRLTGRLPWFIDGSGGIGQLSWPKVVERERVSSKELVARVGRLVVHDQIVAFRAGASTGVASSAASVSKVLCTLTTSYRSMTFSTSGSKRLTGMTLSPHW
jgi:hypothetical protein